MALPLLIVMTCGVIDFARVFYAGIAVESAARAGVQQGTYSIGRVGDRGGTVQAALADFNGQGLTGISVTSRTFCGCNAGFGEVDCSTATCNGSVPSGYVETTASYTFRPITPFPGIPAVVPITSSARMRAQ